MTEYALESMAWVYKMFITFVVVIIAMAVVGSSVRSTINTESVQADLMLQRILYGQNSVWVVQDGMLRPGIVDMDRFKDQNTFNANFDYPPNYGGAKISLYTSGTPINSASAPTLFVNKQTFEQLADNFDAGVANGGRVETHRYPVLVSDAAATYNGYLIIEIAVPSIA